VGGICHGKVRSQTIIVSLKGTVFNQAAYSEGSIDWRLLCGNLSGAEKEDDIVLKRSQHKCGRKDHPGKSSDNERKPLMTSFHCDVPS
jgi:hypothetical protein